MLDIIRLCQEKNIPYLESGHQHCKEGWIQLHCVFCTDGTHGWHLGFSIDGGNMNCWRCGSHSIWQFACSVFSDKGTASAILKQYNQHKILSKKKETVLRKKKAPAPSDMRKLGKVHTRYLKDRKFELDIINDWDIQGTYGFSNKWSWRIIAPIRDIDSTIVSYGGRAIGEGVKPKWKFSTNEDWTIEPKRALYGIDKVPNDRVLIVEGMSDCWRMGYGAVGVFGIDWKEEQASQLKYFKHRFIMFDPEILAQQKAQQLADWLAPFPGETEIITGIKSDPGDLSQKEADEIMSELGF